MNKSIIWFGLLILSISLVSALPITIDQVKLDDFQINPDGLNRMDVQRNQAHELFIRFTPTSNVADVELEIFVSGFEYNDIFPIRDKTGPFDADANVTYTRKMRFILTDEVDEDDYKLRLIITDRNGQQNVLNYNLKFDVPRHSLKIEDIVFTPKGAVKAGQGLVALVRLSNKGERKENDIKVEISVPALNISASDYIDEIRVGKEQESEEIFMKIPSCTKAGEYNAQIKIWFNQRHDIIDGASKILVAEGDCPTTRKQIETALKPAVVITLDGNTPKDNRTFPPNPQQDAGMVDSVRSTLEITLLVLVALLVVIGVVFALKGQMDKREK